MKYRHAVALALAASLATGSAAQDREHVFGVTEDVTYQATPKEIRDKFAPVADCFAKTAGRRVKVVLVPACNDVHAGLPKQEYDLVFIHPAHVPMAGIKGAVPIKELLVSKSMPADEQERIRSALLGIGQSKPGRNALDALGDKGFVAPSADVEASTIAWLGL